MTPQNDKAIAITASNNALSAPGKWWHNHEITDKCRCTHDVGSHTDKTARCSRCTCPLFNRKEKPDV